jgi:hypothetical protein
MNPPLFNDYILIKFYLKKELSHEIGQALKLKFCASHAPCLAL